MNLHISLQALPLATTLLNFGELIISGPLLPKVHSCFWEFLIIINYTTELVIFRSQMVVAFTVIASTFISEAERVKALVCHLDLEEADKACRKAMILRLDLDRDFSWALKCIYLESHD